jgi:general secretion pathway protein N
MRGPGRVLMWTAAAIVSALITVSAFLPAAWLAPLLESRTGGRLTLGDAQGSLWHGSAFIGAAPSGKDAVTALLPGRFVWHLSPLVLLGRVQATLENAQVLSSVVSIRGSWSAWSISPASLALPAERLAALGAPLNTLQPSGKMLLGWQQLRLVLAGNGSGSGSIDVNGVMTLDMLAMASRLSPVKPLGSYRLRFDWQGRQAGLTLMTLSGALLLNGSGKLQDGHLQFSGSAEAAAGQEEKLATLLSLLGQRRQMNGRNVIGLEFKS